MSTKTITIWQKDQQFKSHHGKNEIKIDGKREDGFGAKALVLSAIAPCSGIDMGGARVLCCLTRAGPLGGVRNNTERRREVINRPSRPA